MVIEVEIPTTGDKTIKVLITGMEEKFPVEDGPARNQVNEENMDSRFDKPWQAVRAHNILNEAAKKARKYFWGHESKEVIRSFVNEMDEKGCFLEYTQRQRWTLGGWYSVCWHYLFDIELTQYNMQRFYKARNDVLGRRWSLPDKENLRKFSTKIAEAPPNSHLCSFNFQQNKRIVSLTTAS